MNVNPSNEIAGAPSPSIPGPYQSPEHTEAFPLKQSYHASNLRRRTNGYQLLAGCCGGSDKGGAGLRVIMMCFATLTIAVIVALAIQIYSGDYQEGGNAVDAAIAATFCMGVVNPHVTGLGGTGFIIMDGLARMQNTYLSSRSGDLYNLLSRLEAGHQLTIPNLAAMLELIANKGADVFYNGTLAKNIIDAVAANGGYMTAQDLASYEAVLKQPALEETFAGFRVIVPGLPSGGKLLLEILKNLPDLNTTEAGNNITSHIIPRMVEAAEKTYGYLFQGNPNSDMKFAEGSINFTRAATSHVSSVDLNDIYVSIVSGLNTWLGSQIFVNESFILNNALINFGVDKSIPAPGKRPISIATPVIAVEKRRICGRRLVLGSGDSTIALQLLASMLVLNKDINWSIEFPRFHLENGNGSLFLEGKDRLSDDIIQYLKLSHKIKYLSEPYQSSNIVEKFGDDLASHSDSRGGGVASRF
ncbi:hypothetical protein C0J52_09534 [Blattella germanica]|nr:hypothetical protein C0J52_09534 [Blattella germanica]